MEDLRLIKLAKNILNYSIELKPNEKLLIDVSGEDALPLAKQLMKEAYIIGAIPFYNITNYELLKLTLQNLTEEQVKTWARLDLDKMREMDATVIIKAASNTAELSKVDKEKLDLYNKMYFHPVHIEERVKNKKWCLLRYPNNSMAQANNMDLEEMENFYFNVCNVDYSKMSKAMDNLVNLMNNTDKVHIVSKNTDLTFSIKGIAAQKYCGNFNLPDGEVATAPVKNSVNGYITYNTETHFNGSKFNNVYFEFENGKIVKATSDNSELLNAILDTDEGARYIGEFALGLNPYIEKPVGDTLFDEKIKGSFHFTPGESLKDSDNGNRSAIHWDIVSIQTAEHGGGEIWFDDVLIRKDGIFVLEELKPLNPENLK